MMNLLIADDVGQVKVVTTTPAVDTTQKTSALPSIRSFYEPSPTTTTISLAPLPLSPSATPQPPHGQVIALLRTPCTLSFCTFIPRKVKVADLSGNARLPDTLWNHDLPSDAEIGKWLGMGLEGGILYAWSEKGRIELWGLPEGGVDVQSLEEKKDGEEPKWMFRGGGKVGVSGGMGVSVVKVQPYKGDELPEAITFAVGYTTEGGEVEVFETSTSSWKKDGSKPVNLSFTPIFKSKPPRPDALKLPIPGGVTSICWLPTPTATATATSTTTPTTNRYAKTKPLKPLRHLFLATGTPTGEVRLYDTDTSRRPIFREPLLPRGGAAALRGGLGTNVTRAVGGAGTGAVKCLEFINPPLPEGQGKGDNDTTSSLSFLFSDENAKCGIYVAKRISSSSLSSPSSSAPQYKGRATQLLPGEITGIIRGVGIYNHSSLETKTYGILISIVGLDRYLRVYRWTRDMSKKGGVESVEMVSRVYMHTRGTGVVWVGSVDGVVWETEEGRRERERGERRKEREKEVEEVWEGIEGGEGVDGDSLMVDGEDDEAEVEEDFGSEEGGSEEGGENGSEDSEGSEEVDSDSQPSGDNSSDSDGSEPQSESESEGATPPPQPLKSKKQTRATIPTTNGKRKQVPAPVVISKRSKVRG